ncbi:hypothetical protein MferCBS31731_005815 [Microsporum ferrugineum]
MLKLHVLAVLASTLWQLAVADAGANKTYSFFFSVEQSDSLFTAVSKDCNLALTAPAPACPRQFLQLLSNGGYYSLGSQELMDGLCDTACAPQLVSYRQNVVSACASDPQPREGVPSTYWVDAVSSVREMMCMKDPKSGQYCVDFIEQQLGEAPQQDALLGGYSDDQLCSACVVSLFRHQQSTPYSNYGPDMADAWQAIQARCGLAYPTNVQPLDTNVTLHNQAPSGYPTARCASDRQYTVSAGDNCVAISKSQHVSTGSLVVLNSLRVDCADLLLGQSLCLPPACTDYTVKAGDTCQGLAELYDISFQEIVSWNPLIDSYCTNLVVDQNICIGPPGGYQDFTTVPGASATKTAIYATTTASRPASVASGTTAKCGKYYEAQLGDYCELIAVGNDITFELLRELNPQLDETCSNLLSGVYYCVSPVKDWDMTTSSATVPAPTATTPNTAKVCYEWYVVNPSDHCAKIQDQFAITFEQLQAWNPDLKDDCSNLQLGVAYCVHGPPQATSFSMSDSGDRLHGLTAATQTPAPPGRVTKTAHGGVATGWPGIDSPRYRKIMGLDSEE